MALLEGHVLAALGLPVLGKSLVELHVQFARRVIRHIEQGHVLGPSRCCAQGQSGGCEGKLDKVAAKVHWVVPVVLKSDEWILEAALQNWNYCVFSF